MNCRVCTTPMSPAEPGDICRECSLDQLREMIEKFKRDNPPFEVGPLHPVVIDGEVRWVIPRCTMSMDDIRKMSADVMENAE